MRHMISATSAVLVIWSAGAGSAGAEDGPTSMLLTCSGLDTDYQRTGSTSTTTITPGVDPGIGSAQHRAAVIAGTAQVNTTSTPNMSLVRIPARMTVAIEGDAVRIRPSAGTAPSWLQSKSADGWYALTDVSITDDAIRGKASWGGVFGKSKLKIDRRSGDVEFGSFTGACEKASNNPDAKKF